MARGTIVTGKHGIAQWREKESKVFILFKRYSMFLNDDELEELVALLQAIQQEIDTKIHETVAKYTIT